MTAVHAHLVSPRPVAARAALALFLSLLATPALKAQPAAPAQAAQAKIVAAQGRVERALDQQESWRAAAVFEELFEDNRVRTLEASRAAILFIDETQVKLNANAVLTVNAARPRSAGPTVLNLLRGEGWFRTKNRTNSLTIKTPGASAGIRGTEINVAVRDDETTVLTVVEGSAELSNDQGVLIVDAGEEGTARRGRAPTKRVVLNPEDAVQWTLYYPARVAWHDLPAAALAGPARAGFERLRAGDAAGALAAFEPAVASDPWARIGASVAHLELGRSEEGRALLATPLSDPAAEVERRVRLASAALSTGDAGAARSEIDAARALDPSALSPAVLLSTLELTQNHPSEAAAVAAQALETHPDSVGALVAASEAAQALFDLPLARRYLDRALQADPGDVKALVNRARIRFGAGDTEGARADVDEAARLVPGDPQVASLTGFILLGTGEVEKARERFTAAANADPELAEPHLGLGLLHFRERREREGLLEMLTATLLEPKVSLYQSYLGKAYYQARRFPEGLSAFETAKRLDPRDPTPWLYGSFLLRDLNQQVDALEELRQAIARNDNRAVYRSRLLLDRDLATKNVSLAEIYRQLGFEAWGAFEAQNSLDADIANASAHLFLGETYGRLGDRTQALGSELLQYSLYAPVNRNSFQNFNEYTALFERSASQLAPAVTFGSDERAAVELVSRSGNERFAHVAAVTLSREDGERLQDDDEARRLFAQAKLALGSQSDLFFFFNGSRQEEGQSRLQVRTLGLETGLPIIVRQFVLNPDRTLTNHFDQLEATVGFKHDWRPGSSLTATSRYQYFEQRTENPDNPFACTGINLLQFGALSSSKRRFPFHGYDTQVQQATRFGRHQLVGGAQAFFQDKEQHCSDQAYDAMDRTPLGSQTLSSEGHDRTLTGYLRDEIELRPWLHVTAGLRYDSVRYFDLFAETEFEVSHFNPLAGVSIRLAPTTMLRLAAFRNLNSDFTGTKISPTTVSGFVIERNENPTAIRKEAGLSVEHGFSRAFLGLRGFVRDVTVPALTFFTEEASFLPEAETRVYGASGFYNQILTRRLSLFAESQALHNQTRNFDRDDLQLRLGLNLIHERGFFARVTGSYFRQRFTNTPIEELPQSSFFLADLDLRYEFAKKRGLVSLIVTNAFDRNFNSIVEGLAVNPPEPERRVVLLFRWRI